MKTDGVGPSVAPGHQQNVAASPAAQPSPQKVKPGNWSSSTGKSASTNNATKAIAAKNIARILIRTTIANSKGDLTKLHTDLADAFRNAKPDVRKAMRENPDYKKIMDVWANNLVSPYLRKASISIHPGDEAMRALHDAAIGCDPELASDLVVSATPVFSRYSKGKLIIGLNNNTSIADLKDWIDGAKAPNPNATRAIQRLEALVDKS